MTKSNVTYHARVDDRGHPLGFYPSTAWPTPPEGTVQISAEQYHQWLGGLATSKYYRLVRGVLVLSEPEPATPTIGDAPVTTPDLEDPLPTVNDAVVTPNDSELKDEPIASDETSSRRSRRKKSY